jgi:hypothetical protein
MMVVRILETLDKLIVEENYLPEQITRMDETSFLFLKRIPERTFIHKEPKAMPGFRFCECALYDVREIEIEFLATGKTHKHLGLKLFDPLCAACVCFLPSSSGAPVPTESVAPRWRAPNRSERVSLLLESPEPLRACGPFVGEPRTPRAERSPLSEGGKLRARNGRLLWPYQFDFHVTVRDFLRAVNLRHGTHSVTSLPKEGLLRICYARKKSDGFGQV